MHQPYTVVLVSYNSQYWLAKHLPFYQACQQLVIVDNASQDATCDYVRSQLPNAMLIANKVNLGFGAACNQGAAAAKTPYVLLLNPDCTCEHAAVNQLVQIAQNDAQIAIVAPQVITKQGGLELSYRMGIHAWKAKSGQAAQALLCVEFATGACLLLNKTAFDDVQGFDEAYFMYYEDEDLCLRLRKAGYAIVVEPAAQVQHFARSGSQAKGASGYVQRLKTEYLRGKLHTQAKLKFTRDYHGVKSARKMRHKLRFGSILLLPVKLFSPIYFARTLGRISAAF